MFSDSEKKGKLRVGSWFWTPGIYSETGDVVVASQSNKVWLNGSVNISSETDANKRNNHSDTLYVDGGIKATGTIDGNTKTRLQVNNEAKTTITKPNWRYHMRLTGGDCGSKTRTIPRDVLIALCGPPDGCNGVLGRRLWSPNETTSWSHTFHFIYDKDTQRFRSDSPFGSDGSTISGQGGLGKIADAWGGHCYLTNETWESNQNKGNKGDGLQLRIDGGDRPERECNLTLIP